MAEEHTERPEPVEGTEPVEPVEPVDEEAIVRGRGVVVTIRYCVDCRWQLRAQWYAGELLQTFADEIGGVLVVPAQGGMFRVEADGRTLWNRKTDGGFPEITELKRRVRDVVAPHKSLGHADRSGP